MEGTDIYNDENLQPTRDTDQLSKEMKVIADKYPLVLKDNLYGCKAFEDMPYQKIEMDKNVEPVFKTYVRTTPHHLKESSQGFIEKLLP